MTKRFQSSSSRETQEWADEFAKKLRGPSRAAVVIALQGELGAGKTTFAQGFARALGVKRRLTSPTFTILKRYPILKAKSRRAGFKNLYHVDAYRLKNAGALAVLGLKKVIADPYAIILLEWPERVKGILPRETVRLKFHHGKKENERLIISR